MKKTNQIRINNDELFLITTALSWFKKDDRKIFEHYGFNEQEVELLYTKLIRESVTRRNE